MNDRTQQLAVLLNLMGEENANKAISSFDTEVVEELKQVLREYESDPPSPAEIEMVLDDFERYFQFAFKHLEALETGETADAQPEIADTPVATDDAPSVISFPKPDLTGEVTHDLNLLHPYQIAYAIRNDNPNSIVVVLKSLSDSRAAQALEELPEDVRLDVFLRMADAAEMHPEIEKQILSAALESALLVESRVPEVDRTGQLVALSRSLPKKVRVPLLEKLNEVNDELAKNVKESMYRFDDLLKLESQDIQKVLGQCDTDSLVLALVKAEEDVKEKLMSSVSKRARQTIEEELEYKTKATEEEIEAGKKEVVMVLMRMDEAGEITLE